MMARIPAKDGAPKEVPPTADKPPLASRKPFTQLPAVQNSAGSWKLEAFKEISGTSRFPSFGTPGPVCQGAWALVKIVLAPPPLAANPPGGTRASDCVV